MIFKLLLCLQGRFSCIAPVVGVPHGSKLVYWKISFPIDNFEDVAKTGNVSSEFCKSPKLFISCMSFHTL